MSRCKIPKFCEIYKISIGIYDPKSPRKLPRSLKQRVDCVYIQKNHYCAIWKKSRKDASLNGVDKIDKRIQMC